MLLILDSNQYIFALGEVRDPSCERLIDLLPALSNRITIRLPRLIVEEVRNNLTSEAFREFILLINSLTSIDEDSLIPFDLGAKYEARGLKPADALIGAYADFVGADALVSENRHFLTRQPNLPFKVINAAACLKIIGQ